MTRRHLLAAPLVSFAAAAQSARPVRLSGTRLRLSLNSYSFNQPLRRGEITLFDVVEFCAAHTIEGLDATGYYFPGYPADPPAQFVRDLKRHALLNGVTIHGTGVRNDFATADEAQRTADLALTRRWIDTAAQLGATIIRVFGGRPLPAHESFDDAFPRMVAALGEAAEYGRQRGVMIGLQNHNEAIKTAAQTIRILEAVNSEWLGVVLDIGSLRQHDPYQEIEALIPYAISWQVKEFVWENGKESPVDITRLGGIIRRAGYRGWFPVETLGPGDPFQKLPPFIAKVRSIVG